MVTSSFLFNNSGSDFTSYTWGISYHSYFKNNYSSFIKSILVLYLLLYLVLFVLSIVIVFRVIPYVIGLFVIPAVLLFADRKALKDVDYGLLLTFVFFFVFAGNMARIDAVRDFFSFLLEKNTLVFSAMSCQVISNLPSSLLISQFTDNYTDLLRGVNVGSVGTLISSLASLITFREYVKYNPGKTLYYIAMFSAFNYAFLFTLIAVCASYIKPNG